MSKLLLGDDGEIYTKIDAVKGSKKTVESSIVSSLPLSAPLDQETELLLALPQLFLLDPDNVAFIAGKKMKLRREAISPMSGWFEDGKIFASSFVYFFILGLFLVILGTRRYLRDFMVAIEASFNFTVFMVGTVFAIYILGRLTSFLELRGKERTERFRRTHGILLKGQIVGFKRRALFDSQSDEIRYQFVTPDRNIVTQKQLIPRQGMRGDTNRSYSVEIGTPVAILYTDDKTFKLL